MTNWTATATPPGTRARLSAALWLAQPVYLVVELIAAALATAPYTLLHHTISDLGATTCTTIAYPSQDVPVCSPAHLAVNASFVLFGVAMAVGALLLRPWLPRSGLTTAAVVLWVVAGASSIGSGLTPLDQLLELHALVSTPGIVVSGAAMALTGSALARSSGRSWWWLVAAGAISTMAGVLMVVRLEVQWGGLIERIALWPSFAACAVVALAVLRNRPAVDLPIPR
ncbi:DUF998 domain-containing protein [Ruania zhangjianzhongii]|uniref:DUF998 domain-containing protein n=1 Tax=Ruania zhangjianzhongii TaxID=2603206 RepID=UPI0011CC26D3|nr:DUF998 domain-containing protein [Ruania zhangjianzhongii]